MYLDNGEWDKLELQNVQVKELLVRLATDWRNYQRDAQGGYGSSSSGSGNGGGTSFVAVDWSENIDSFLECVPNELQG